MAEELTTHELNLRQQRFCIEYVIDYNGTQAAIRAGYSEDTARSIACELLTKPYIADEIKRLNDDKITRAKATADTVLSNIYKISEVDIGDAYDEKGCLLPIKQIPKEIRKIIASVETFEEFGYEDQPNGTKKKIVIGHTVKVKFWSKDKSNELLAKHHKLITDKHEIAGPNGTPLMPAQINIIGVESSENPPA
jgi:phage terminase small subunit